MYREGIMQKVTTMRQAYGPSALHFEQLADSAVLTGSLSPLTAVQQTSDSA